MTSCALRLALLASMVSSAPVLGATIIVPDDQPTVQDAVDVAVSFDVIQVRPGAVSDRVLVVGKSDLRIEGLGGRPAFPPANRKDGFDVRSSARVVLRGFDFQNRKTAVTLTDCTDCAVDDMQATACREGIVALRSTGVIVAGSTVADTGKGRGIAVDRSAGAQILGNVVSGGKNEGIRVTLSDGANVFGNTSNANQRGLVMRDCDGSRASANVTNGNRADGVRVDHADDGSVDDGLSIGNGGFGVRVDDSPSVTVALYVTNENGNDGLRVNDCAGALLVDNQSDDNDDYGIRVDDSPPLATVQDLIDTGNTASGNGEGDLRVDP